MRNASTAAEERQAIPPVSGSTPPATPGGGGPRIAPVMLQFTCMHTSRVTTWVKVPAPLPARESKSA
ncbi:MAG: hypothetical protein IPJ65_23755 [Archangiaceae bacterium]|nr:hypothetical protein [Archangiaceae bacterium]